MPTKSIYEYDWQTCLVVNLSGDFFWEWEKRDARNHVSWAIGDLCEDQFHDSPAGEAGVTPCPTPLMQDLVIHVIEKFTGPTGGWLSDPNTVCREIVDELKNWNTEAEAPAVSEEPTKKYCTRCYAPLTLCYPTGNPEQARWVSDTPNGPKTVCHPQFGDYAHTTKPLKAGRASEGIGNATCSGRISKK